MYRRLGLEGAVRLEPFDKEIEGGDVSIERKVLGDLLEIAARLSFHDVGDEFSRIICNSAPSAWVEVLPRQVRKNTYSHVSLETL